MAATNKLDTILWPSVVFPRKDDGSSVLLHELTM